MKPIVILAVVLTTALAAHGQFQPSKADSTPRKSGTTLDALTTVFQTDVTTGNSGGATFKSTIFGFRKLFSKDSLNASAYYLSHYGERNTEISIGVNNGSNKNLDILTAAFKYAIFNHRDRTTANFNKESGGLLNNFLLTLGKAENQAIQQYLESIRGDDAKVKELMDAAARFQKSGDIKEYPQAVQDSYLHILKEQYDIDSPDKSARVIYNQVAKKIDLRGLLTASFNPGYDFSKGQFDTTSFNMEYVRGFGNYKRPWNLDLTGSVVWQQDTLDNTKNLNRTLYISKLGLTKVLVTDSKSNSKLELQLAYEEDYVGTGLYKKEQNSQPKLVTTLRYYITPDIAIPLTLKYDLIHPNLFGFLNFTWNFDTGSNAKKSS